LKYTTDRQPVIEGIQRVSKPGLRIYAQRNTIPRVLGGYGTTVISTSKGIITGHQARMMGLGGEVVCKIW
jgi:small subunit ribosomal protein S8